MADTDPIVERLADHSDMLATLTNIIDRLTRRVERLEAGNPESPLTFTACYHARYCTICHD